MTSVQVAMANSGGSGDTGAWDSDGSLSWEDFFGTSTDLVPTLLGMYDALVGRPSQPSTPAMEVPPAQAPPSTSAPGVLVSRPLSISSIASSSSSSSGTSSCSGRRLGTAPKSSAYLASIESLEDDDDSEDESRLKKPADRLLKTSGGGSGGSQGSGDSGVCSPCSYISSPCPPPGRPRYCDPHLSYMDRVVMEIIETEGVYVRDLHQIIEGYLEKWRNSSDCPLSDKQLADLFSNIEDIYRFNSGFLQELEQCGLDPVRVAQCFVRNNSGFSIYTQYCTNYPRTVSILTELMRQEATVRLFRERQTSLQHTLPLGSYLLKPVQRILKYHLLLQNIVKHYVYEAEGYSDIVEALSAMTGIAHHINDMKRRHEHAVRVQEIQSLLYGWEGEDLTTFGELCAEGTFRMHGAKALRHAFLFDRMLLITKKKEESILGYKTHIMCSNLMLIESVPGEPLSFHVIPFDNPRLQYTLQARNLEQKREWTLQLKRVILENYNAVIPSHARQLVMELGQNRTDDEIMAEKATPKRQHSAPEYLEKRKQERERRKSETGLRYRLRRSRKSDVGATEMTSPLASRRGRRASSSSRDRSQSREDTRRSTSPHTKLKDRFGSWRRKSEPGCYTIPSLRKSSSSKLSIPMEAKPNEKDNSSITSEDLSQCQADGGQEQDDIKSETEDELEKKEEAAEEEEEEEEEAKTLEEIVSQLVMQNREFQKILKKQQRHVNRHRHREETTDTENEDEGNDVYETLSRPITNSSQSYRAHRHAHMRSLRNEQKTLSSRTQQEPEYVTLKCESVPDKPEDGFGNYDNLQLIWESVQRQQVEIQRLADDGSDLRRTRSFSCHLRGLPPSTSQASLDIPTLPAVWLKQQGEHLATPNKKSGSLPRSFQLSHEESPSSYRSRPLARDSRSTSDRPFTIASDKPPEINFEDIERYIEESDTCNVRHRFPINPGDTTEDESVTDYTNTPGTSLNELNVHPEYKIYRPSMSRASLRHVISSMSSKLRVSSETLDTGAEVSSHSGSDRRASRLVYELARQYSKTLKQRIRNIMGEDVSTPTGPAEDYYDTVHSQRTPSPPVAPAPVPSPLPIYKQGSSSLGARIAHCSSEYANPRQLYSNIPPPPSHSDTRPDSVLSLSSNFTMSSSEGEKTSGFGGSVDTTVCNSSVTLQEDAHFSDGSADSYYERSFEAIENFLENEMFRDSAVFSDHEDSNEPAPKKAPPPPKPARQKVPPPVPAKPEALKAKSMANSQGFEGIKKSIRERRRELELWKANSRDDDTSSQHSTASTVIEVSPASTEEATDSNTASTPRGWVKHVIGKLQGSPSEESRLPPQ